ncbi:MAG: formate/nitrite transporter family protein [Clostridia bacterium]|nr:formate/nitrite transporter family protein [Clostridia bacterium]
MIRKMLSGVCAGLLVSIGGAVFLACENRYVGAALFSVALLCICMKGYALFTGKVGDLPERHAKEDVSTLLLALLGNLIGAVATGYLVRWGLPALGSTAESLCRGKLAQQAPYQSFIRALFCGNLMYLAVSTYRDNQTPLGILFCIPVFILSGFEHSIADMFYFAASGMVSFRAFAFIWIVIAGNAAGGMLLPALGRIGQKEEGA